MSKIATQSRFRRAAQLIGVSGLLLIVCSMVAVWRAQAQSASNELDLTFGTNGRVITDFSNPDMPSAVVLQPDGKIVVAGNSGTLSAISLARYAANGAPDAAFGTGGKVTRSFNNLNVVINAAALQADNKIVVAGVVNDFGAAGLNFFAARFNSDGSPDTTFGANGIAINDIRNTNDGATALVIQTDGRILLGGQSKRTSTAISDSDLGLLRLNANGALDGSFGAGGRLVTALSNSINTNTGAGITDLALTTDGKIVAVSQPVINGVIGFTVTRYNPNGTLDTSFDNDGVAVTPFFNNSGRANAVAVLTSGKIIVGGSARNDCCDDNFALARYNADGSLDTTFDGDGLLTTNFFVFAEQINKIAVQPDGKIVAAGFTNTSQTTDDFAVARYNPDGSPDTSFSTDGRTNTDFGGNERATDVALQPDGKIVVGGVFVASNGQSDFLTARYLGASGANATPTPTPANSTFQFSLTDYTANEAAGQAVVTVTRAGSAANSATVELTTADGTASQRTDYTLLNSLLNFAAGETSRTVVIPIINDGYVEANETVLLTLSAPTNGSSLGAPNSATLTIQSDDAAAPTANPLDDARFFARQQYFDFLNRFPDQAGEDFWTGQITQCGGDTNCINRQRVSVSAAFFQSQEFQETGFVVYRLYRAAYGNLPAPNNTRANLSYGVFSRDRAQLVGGAQLAQNTVEFANRFVQRAEFLTEYPASLTNEQFVNKLFDTANLTGAAFTSERQNQINAMNQNGQTRAQTLLNVTNLAAFVQRETNPAFVLMQYFGYLRRDPDQPGYDFWLNVLNNQSNNGTRVMVCNFITSREYQERFSRELLLTNGFCSGNL